MIEKRYKCKRCGSGHMERDIRRYDYETNTYSVACPNCGESTPQCDRITFALWLFEHDNEAVAQKHAELKAARVDAWEKWLAADDAVQAFEAANMNRRKP